MQNEPPKLDPETFRSVARDLVRVDVPEDREASLLDTVNSVLAEVVHVTREARGEAEPDLQFRLAEWKS